MNVPAWVQDSVFYQIFPDRFANGDPANDPPNVQQWGERPTVLGFQGGDLRGIGQRIDYLVDLGVNAIYLNPIFQASSNHRYDTINYYMIDPKLGSSKDFSQLVDKAHSNGIRIILDGVFNHCGRGFFAFVDVMENQQDSPYLEWFHIKRFPLHAYEGGEARNYRGWYKLKSLPKFNTQNPQVREYIFGVARYWIEQGADGWRLDVPNEIDDDSFWAEFRHVVKQTNPDAYLLGEIWNVDPRWVGSNHFDGLMNYPLRDALLELIVENKISSSEFMRKVQSIVEAYPQENTFSHYVPLGSHDTPRLATILDGDQRKIKLFNQMLFCFPGAPAIYYGDEIGLKGEKDPDSRRAFPWEEDAWDPELRNFMRQLIQLRKTYIELRRGQVRFLKSEQSGAVAMARTYQGSSVLLVFNATNTALDFSLPVVELAWADSTPISDLLSKTRHVVTEGKLGLHLPPYQALMLAPA